MSSFCLKCFSSVSRERVSNAFKSSLMYAIAFYIALASGLDYPMIAAASTRSLGFEGKGTYGQAMQKALIRLLSTFIGFAIGITLLALFPQFVWSYFFAAGVFVFLFAYLLGANPTYPTMGYAMTYIPYSMLVLFNISGSGNVEAVTLYALGRVEEFVLGYVVFFIFALWWWRSNSKVIDTVLEEATQELQLYYSAVVHNDTDEVGELRHRQFTTLKKLHNTLYFALYDTSKVQEQAKAYKNILGLHQKIAYLLSSLSETLNHFPSIASSAEAKAHFAFLERLLASLSSCKAYARPLTAFPIEPHCEQSILFEYIRRLGIYITELNNNYTGIHTNTKVYSAYSALLPFRFEWSLLDSDAMKMALRVFMLFWVVVALFYLTYDNQANYLFIVFSVGFIFIASSRSPYQAQGYFLPFNLGAVIGVLLFIASAHFNSGYVLTLLIFCYSFIAFYSRAEDHMTLPMFVPLYMIPYANIQHYDLLGYINELLSMDLVLIVLILSRYFPFRLDPHRDLVRLQKNFFASSALHIVLHSDMMEHAITWRNRIRYQHASTQIKQSGAKMHLALASLDKEYLHTNTKKSLEHFIACCETYSTLLEQLQLSDFLMDTKIVRLSKPRAKKIKQAFAEMILSKKEVDFKALEEQTEHHRNAFLTEYYEGKISLDEIVELLKRIDVFYAMQHAMNNVIEASKNISWEALKEKRF